MSDQIQKLLLTFGVAMVGLIAFLFALQVGFGSLADEEPQMVNPQSLLVAALFALGIAIVFGSDAGNNDQSDG